MQLTAFDPDGDNLLYSVAPVPMPANSSFNAATGLYKYTPDETQIGSLTITL
ncbi:hypothetical protein [Bathymodiolus platifrons methanotrophic gill symbiont]|uniref:hypothetical protein n=1 Tax=Bathymodiolus platifrons methanotrophic gill symbiont TaxID=113268 RepID=UPI003B8490FA